MYVSIYFQFASPLSLKMVNCASVIIWSEDLKTKLDHGQNHVWCTWISNISPTSSHKENKKWNKKTKRLQHWTVSDNFWILHMTNQRVSGWVPVIGWIGRLRFQWDPCGGGDDPLGIVAHILWANLQQGGVLVLGCCPGVGLQDPVSWVLPWGPLPVDLQMKFFLSLIFLNFIALWCLKPCMPMGIRLCRYQNTIIMIKICSLLMF